MQMFRPDTNLERSGNVPQNAGSIWSVAGLQNSTLDLTIRTGNPLAAFFVISTYEY